MLLSVTQVDTFYGKVQALHGVSLELNKGEIVSIIGANGAGKTTLISTITGMVPCADGSIIYKGEEISDLSPHEIASRRLTSVPEGRRIFPKLSVRENLEIGAYSRKMSSRQVEQEIEVIYDMFPRLREREKQMGGTLSGGEQQMLAIGRGLMNQPEILILDEPSLGLAPIVVDGVFEILPRINKELGVSILLVEQNAYMAMETSNRTYVLENGVITNSGLSADLLNDPVVVKSYLGG